MSVDFPQTGLIGLQAKNLRTNGSSGAGKSAFLDGISYALGCAPLPATELQSWPTTTDTKLSVTVVLDTPTGQARVTRGHGACGQLESGPLLKGAAGGTKVLQEALGIDSDLLQLLTYRPQNTGSAFLSLDDAQKRVILGKAIPTLSQLEKLSDDCQARAKEALNKVAIDAAAATAAARQLEAFEETAEASPLPSAEEARAAEALLNDQVREATAAFNAAVAAARTAEAAWAAARAEVRSARHAESAELERQASALMTPPPAPVSVRVIGSVLPVYESEPQAPEEVEARAALTECDRRIAALQDRDRQGRTSRDGYIRAATQMVRHLTVEASKAERLKRDQSAQRSFIASLQAADCPTCHREWPEAIDSRELLEVQVQLERTTEELAAALQAAEKLVEAQASLDQLTPWESDPIIEQLEGVRRHLADKVSRFEADRAAAARIDRANKAAQAAGLRQRAAQLDEMARQVAQKAADVLEQPYLDLKRKADLRQAEAFGLGARLERAVNETRWAVDRESQRLRCTRAVVEAREALAASQVASDLENDLAEAVGRQGFFGLIFAEILAEVSADASRVLGLVPNTSHVTVRLATDVGSRKTITPIVNVGGNEGPMRSALSGGMGRVVMLAIDLAFGAVVSRRTGACPGWLFLDEPLDGLGVVEKEAMLGVLQHYAKDRLIIVVDHATEAKELFDQVLKLEFDGNVTRMV